ncbi:MAG TPA: hypothetical protein VH144_00425 [Candidatus Saccharimonadales bacterium]|nr:hypothetical protein [Candidatus Saccharimonadales bacterium]
MQQDGNAKQLITERIKNATNILVTVSANPSVDELSAALGLTLILNKMDKHATAVFSGSVPPAIQFLEPGKTFENTVDSLRDFIIALDKEKADRLRYKVEDDVVRIFITPYRTTITQKDLEFSQGDFNVELIIALGVEKREDLDNAIVAHGRILHDATVVTINARDDKSTLGSIDWQDANASSLCEMLVSISESLGGGLLDQQIANALLTGIVAATERFSNQHTSPRVMTMAAQLMAAGANQQLIATQLEEANEIPSPNNDGSTSLKEGGSAKLKKPEAAPPAEKPKANGELDIKHDPQVEKSKAAATSAENLATKAEEQLSQQLDAKAAPVGINTNTVASDLAAETAKQAAQKPADQSSWKDREVGPPTMGGTLNATSEEAMQDNIAAAEEARNHTILSHDSPITSPPVFNSSSLPQNNQSSIPPLDFEPAQLPTARPTTIQPLAPVPQPEPELPNNDDQGQTISELEAKAHAEEAAAIAKPSEEVADTVDQARAAVTTAFNGMPFDPARNPAPQSMGAQPGLAISHNDQPAPVMPPAPQFNLPLPDMSTLPPLPPLDTAPPVTPTETPTALPPLPSQPAPSPLPDQSLPPLPSIKTDPGQFRIPGQ